MKGPFQPRQSTAHAAGMGSGRGEGEQKAARGILYTLSSSQLVHTLQEKAAMSLQMSRLCSVDTDWAGCPRAALGINRLLLAVCSKCCRGRHR